MRTASVVALAFLSIVASVPLHVGAAAGSLSGKVIALDAGHGGSDAGGSGLGLVEKDVNLDVVLRARDLLQADGASVVLTRDCDCTVNLTTRVAIANAALADRFVSVHSNTCGCSTASGTETYYWSGLSATSTSAGFASQLQAQVVSLLGTRDRGVKSADFYTLHHTSMPAVHVELGFLDNATDNAKLAQAAVRQEAARAVLFAVQQQFGIAPHDPDPFAVAIAQPAEQAWLAGTVTAQGEANQAALRWMRFLVDGQVQKWVTPDPHAWSWDTSAFPDGPRVLRLEGENANGTRAAAERTVRLDNTPPVSTVTLAGTRGLEGWWRSDVAVRLDARDAGIGVGSVQLVADGSDADGSEATLRGDGFHAIAYAATDLLGNAEALRALDVAIDAGPPKVTLVAPAEGHVYVGGTDEADGAPRTIVVGEMTVQALAADAWSGVARVELRVDGALRAAATKAPFDLDWRAGDEAAGEHVVQVVAYDHAGNSAADGRSVTTVPTTTTGALATLRALP